MSDSQRGLYETLITEALEARLRDLGDRLVAQSDGLRPADAGDRIALHLSRAIQRAIEGIGDRNRVRDGVALARRLLAEIDTFLASSHLAAERPVDPGRVLHSLAERRVDGSAETIETPLIPLLDTTLLTNAPGEPRVGRQLQTEINSADRIDIVMAFIRRSGIAPMRDALRRHCDAGRTLRVLTTTYTGTTEGPALDLLTDVGAQVRVSYNISSTRLHAKAWLFQRRSGFSTAYVGSSNLTHMAQVSGLEWNVRVSGARNPEVIEKVAAVFESYWSCGEFEDYDPDQFRARTTSATSTAPALLLSPVELRLEPFQERLLEQVEMSRRRGYHRNLIAAATGTGKTVMAAVDYARLQARLPRARLLFVAHREEILAQSLATFRHALREPSFGELWVAGKRPQRFEHVFASIQSLHAAGLDTLTPDHFDVVIVDEFHHAAARSYRALLEHLSPRQLLGLTATPERSDGLPVLSWFGDRIAAELRLWDAIDQHRLTPFLYYGIHDGLDLRAIPWRRGSGYDRERLSNLITGDDVWARIVVTQLREHVDDMGDMRALGFCVSVSHARFMAQVFNDVGLEATAIWADTPEAERKASLRDLAGGRLKVVFSVDLFNEGVDVPEVNTLLLLRPTDSPTLFLQQLGRGLRRYQGKSVCTVLDFVGHHRKEFRFDRRLRALLGGTRRQVEQQVRGGFPFLPAGCHMQLDPVAQEIVLRSLREATPSHWTAKVTELRALAHGGAPTSLGAYLTETGLELDDVYSSTHCWSDLRQAAGLAVQAAGPDEEVLRRACGRMLHVDDSERLTAYRELLSSSQPPDISQLSERERRLLRMLVASVVSKAVDKSASLASGCEVLFSHPQVCAELLELLTILEQQIAHLHVGLSVLPDVPLQIHARYTRVEILAAFGLGEGAKVAPWQTGVYWARDVPADLLAFTLDKTSGQFSPTTRYRDYAISRELIHWESQSMTRADGDTGLRYQQHQRRGSHVMLFARHRADDRAFYFLGPARYVTHDSERPMSITWRLEHALPGDLFASFAAAVA
ncbi:MAG: DEAD/DEAH box helicase [Haliangiales bacterium]